MKKKSIRIILLRTLLILSVVTLLFTSAVFSVMQYNTLKNHATRDMQANCRSIAGSLSQSIKEMDTILLYSIASSELKEDFSGFMAADTSIGKFRSRQKLAGTMIALKGFDFSIRQLNIYDPESGGYGVGNYNGEIPGSVKEQPWYGKTLENAGKKYIYAPAADPAASEAAGVMSDTLYFSLCRMFYGDMHIPIGFLEVKMYYDELFKRISFEGGGLEPVIVVYDSYGRQVYPAYSVFPYYSYREAGDGEIKNTYTGRTQYLCFSEDEDDALTVAMAVDEAVFMVPVYRSFIPFIAGVAVIFLVCLGLAAALSRQMSDPIRKIYEFLSKPGEGGFEKMELMDSGVIEIDTLRDSINESIQVKESTTKTMLTLKEQEMQARMLALQSQMNPHFLYNSLSMIGEMAERGMTEEVSEMCGDITSILRYISSDSEQRISVEEEMEQVDRFLRCMKRRFGDGLVFRYDIEDGILDCMVPKLCVQLLVENAIKAVTSHREPWEIAVEGSGNDREWHITVSDNGPGFEEDVDRRLRKDMDGILKTGILPSLKIEGMGILNIFIRLYLMDGIPFVFDFGNKAEGGAFVTIGGYIHGADRPL